MTTSPQPSRWQQASAARGSRWATGVAIAAVTLLLLIAAIALANVAGADPGADERPGTARGQAQGPKDKAGTNGNGNGVSKGNGSAKAAPAPADVNGIPGQFGKGVLHGEVTRTGATGAPEVLLVQHGSVTSATATSVTVKSDDGYSNTYAITATTRTRGPAKAAGLTAGTDVTIVAQKAGKAALLVASTGRPS